MYQAPRGTADTLPADQSSWRYVENTIAHICQLYGYERIDTPAFEETGLFARSVGEETDIVQKQMYTFTDRGGSQMTLRPEGTAPVCRAYLEHGMHNLPQPVKLYYLTSVFRYERPQSGRYRQHHQFGYEAIGDGDAALDAEVIDMAWQLYKSLGLTRLSLKLNSIGCKGCRRDYLSALKNYYTRHAGNLCPDCKARLGRNPLRLLDCKNPSCQQSADAAPKSTDHLCPPCLEHFTRLEHLLGRLELPFETDHRLVRGLDYYTRTVFEVQPEAEGSQSTIGGGGRYDDLIEELGGRPTPAIGFATGIERIILNLNRQKVAVPPLPHPQVFIVFTGEAARDEVLKLAAQLRRAGTGVIAATSGKSLKAQLRQANNLHVPYAVIIGEEELKAGSVILRDMTTSKQESVPVRQLGKILRLRNT